MSYLFHLKYFIKWASNVLRVTYVDSFPHYACKTVSKLSVFADDWLKIDLIFNIYSFTMPQKTWSKYKIDEMLLKFVSWSSALKEIEIFFIQPLIK